MRTILLAFLWLAAFLFCLFTGHIIPFVLGAVAVGVVWLANGRGKR